MKTQLRRYEIVPGGMDEFLVSWRELMAVHELYGFTVRFAFVDEERSELVYAVSHDGDFDAAMITYRASPERGAVEHAVHLCSAAHLSEVRVEVESS